MGHAPENSVKFLIEDGFQEQLSQRSHLLQSWGAGCVNVGGSCKGIPCGFVCIQPWKGFLCFLALRVIFK